MRILVDEDIPRMTVDALRALGHEVLDIRGTSDQGIADFGLWRLASAESRVLLATDKGLTEYLVGAAPRHSDCAPSTAEPAKDP